MYFDGYDREDVVQCRTQLLGKMAELDKKSLTFDGTIPQLRPGEVCMMKALILVVHDESTYFANSNRSYFWDDEETNVLRQKSLGASIMVSDFVNKVAAICEVEEKQYVHC